MPIRAKDHVWVIGGGPDVYNSGYHIEYNVNWVLEVLRNLPGDREIHVYFGSGDGEVKDVVEWSSPTEGLDQLQPLARVFGNHMQNGETYRRHQLIEITESTSRDQLIASLKSDFGQLQPDDRVFIIYIGHGLHNGQDVGLNTLRLWDDTRLSAREFESLLSEIDPSVPTRFLFSQCYSGGFARLIHPKGDDVLELAEGNRCGFMASSERRQSEGCAASTKLGDYRDYTTQFLAAFSGVTRQGKAVTENVDLDEDGRITMFDAHLFALTQGYSRSMPRSTSETFLEKWQPWYLRWLGTSDEPDNFYGRMARRAAEKLQLPEQGSDLVAELRERRAVLQATQAQLETEKNRNILLINKIQDDIRRAIEYEYPEVRYPYTRNFVQFLSTNLDDAQLLIMRHPDYEQLATLQDRQSAIGSSVLGLERDTVELDKVLRLRKLSRLQQQFDTHANDAEHESMQRLLACETSTM